MTSHTALFLSSISEQCEISHTCRLHVSSGELYTLWDNKKPSQVKNEYFLKIYLYNPIQRRMNPGMRNTKYIFTNIPITSNESGMTLPTRKKGIPVTRPATPNEK
jgi:hypothetical protein